MNRPPRASEARQPFPRGLVLFPPGTPRKRRQRRLAFTVFYVVIVAALVWPVYPLLAGLLPPILGLPPSLAWVMLVLAATFVALLALYLTEGESPRDPPGASPEES